MKNAPLTKRVRISKSCFRLQQEETTTPTDSSKLEEDRPERFSPHDKFQVISLSLADVKKRFKRCSERKTKATLTDLDKIARHRCEKLLKARMGSDSFAEFLKCPQPGLDVRTGHDLICNSPTLLLEKLEAMEGLKDEPI